MAAILSTIGTRTPLENRTYPYHSNSERVWYSSPHCTGHPITRPTQNKDLLVGNSSGKRRLCKKRPNSGLVFRCYSNFRLKSWLFSLVVGRPFRNWISQNQTCIYFSITGQVRYSDHDSNIIEHSSCYRSILFIICDKKN